MHLFEAAVVPVSQLSAGRISAVWSLEPSLTAKSTKFGEIFTRPLNHSRKTDADIGGLTYYRLASARQAPRRELWGHIHPALGKQVLSLVRFFPEDRHSELESGLNFAHSVQTGQNVRCHAAFSDARSRTLSPQDRPHPFSAHLCGRNFLASPADSFHGLGKSTPPSGIFASETENGVRWVR